MNNTHNAIDIKKNEQPDAPLQDNILIQVIKKTKKQEPKIFPSLMLVDKEAFGEENGTSNTKMIMKEFWHSQSNRIIVARKKDT